MSAGIKSRLTVQLSGGQGADECEVATDNQSSWGCRMASDSAVRLERLLGRMVFGVILQIELGEIWKEHYADSNHDGCNNEYCPTGQAPEVPQAQGGSDWQG